jgi:hypothetical protein
MKVAAGFNRTGDKGDYGAPDSRELESVRLRAKEWGYTGATETKERGLF